MKKSLFILMLLFYAIGIFNLAAQDKDSTDLAYQKKQREIAQKKIALLKKYEGWTGEQIKAIPKYDRPDLAAAQNLEMIINPTLGYVPEGAAFKAYKETQRRIRLKSRARAIQNVTWSERGPNNVGGLTRALMFDPNDATNKKVWAAGETGGIWSNTDITDANVPWQAVDDFWANLVVNTLAYDPSNTQIFYAGTGFKTKQGAGIWKSSDGGTNWSQLSSTAISNTSNFKFVQHVAVTSIGVVLANTRNGLFRSTDQGVNWSKIPTNITSPANSFENNALKIASNGNIYISVGGYFGNTARGVMISTDNGLTFTEITPATGALRIELAVSPSAPNTLYAIASDATDQNKILWFYKTTDAGANWTAKAIPKETSQTTCALTTADFTRGQAFHNIMIQVHPTNPNIVFLGGIDILRSTDGGTNWSLLSYWTGGCSKPKVHADQHAMEFRPGNNNEAIFGNDGGVYYSSDVGNAVSPTFGARNKGYNVTQFYAMDMLNTCGSDVMLAGAQDNGTQRFTGAGISSTTEASGGDGAYCHIDQDNGNFQITAYTNNIYYFSTDGGATFPEIIDKSSGRFINPTDYDDGQNILYAAGKADTLVRILVTAATPVYDAKFLNMGGNLISAVKVSPYTTNRVFVANDAGEVYKIENANAASPSISQISTSSLPTGYIKCIAVGSSDNQIMVTYTNYGLTSQVWETLNGGTTWVSKKGNFPDMPIRWALYNPNDYKQVLLATEQGVWSVEDVSVASPVWEATNANLATVRCDMLQYRTSDKLVGVATYGRGVFTSNVFQTLVTNLSAGTQTACVPATNSYTQQVTVTFANKPSSGTLDVNGQSFAITTSPQTVTLTNLTADGNAVNVTANFSAVGSCGAKTVNNLFTAPANCASASVCAISALSAGTQTACVAATNKYTQPVTVTFANKPSSGTLDVNGQSFTIGTSPQTVTLTNLTADGNAVNVTANFSALTSCTKTVSNLFTAPASCTPPCAISALSAGTATGCIPATNKYTRQVIVTFANKPSSGTLDVNGQSFTIGTSPQTVLLTNLPADGNAVNVTANFSALTSCTKTVTGLFTASASCAAPEITVTGVLNGGTLNLGATSLGTNLTKTITITNDGSANLSVTAVTISAIAGITISAPLAVTASILPAQTATFSVLMDATTLGTKTAIITIANNDADESSFVINLTGVVQNAPTGGGGSSTIDYTITPPTNLIGVSVATNQINLNWLDNSDNEDGFQVYNNGVLIATLAPGTTSFKVLGLAANTFYSFKIRAFNSQRIGNSNTLYIATLPNPPSLLESIGVCGANGVAYLKLGNLPERGSFHWYADITSGTKLAEITAGYFTTPNITKTTTFYATAVSSQGLESSPRIAVKAYVYEAVKASILEGNTILECGTQTTIHALEQTGATYEWKANGVLSSQTGLAFNVTASGTYQLLVKRNNCSDTYSFDVSVNYKPSAIIQNGSSVDFCQTGTLQAANTTSKVSYEWLLNGSVIGKGASTKVSKSGTYTLRVTESSCTNEAQIAVNIFDLPQNQAVTASATQFCATDPVTLTVPSIANVNYQWFRNGIQISSARNNTYTTSQEGEYSVVMSVTGLNCSTTSQSLAISQFVTPKVELTRDDKLLKLAIPIPHQSVKWFTTGGEVTQFANQTSLSSPPFATYWALITYPTACEVFSNSIRFFKASTFGDGVTGLEDDEEETTFEVFPNPSENGIFQIRLINILTTDAELKLNDALGRDLNINITIKQGAETIELDLSDFSDGVYYLNLVSEGDIITKKIIKQ